MAEFRCRRCGNCCRWPGHVHVTDREVDAIAAMLGMSPEDFIETYTRLTEDRRGLSLIENELGHCIFLENTEPATCRIDENKPQQCRDFPARWNFPGWEKECAGGGEM